MTAQQLAIERASLLQLPIQLPGTPVIKAVNAVPIPTESIQHSLSVYAALVGAI